MFVECMVPTKDKNIQNRPSYDNYPAMARYLVHKANWTAMGTLSSQPNIHGFPMVNIISIADSVTIGPSSGHIYFLLTDLDFTGQDLHVVNKLTALFSEDQDLSCTRNGTDSMEPTCGRVIITGSVQRLDPNSTEYATADQWYTDRHPASVHWRNTHQFYFCELDIEQIVLLDFYGGPHYVSIDDYYNANYDAESSLDNARALNAIEPTVILVNNSNK